MTDPIKSLIEKIQDKNLVPSVNLDRPFYIQPEDSIKYRSFRIILICGALNTKNGLSKEVIACIDFLLRNTSYQEKFIIEYFKGNKNLMSKLRKYRKTENIDPDFNIVQYKNVPWDLRFNDMLFFLHSNQLIDCKGDKSNTRIFISDKGKSYFEQIKEVFQDEVGFLSVFGKSVCESKLEFIITKVIPETFWRENEKFTYQ